MSARDDSAGGVGSVGSLGGVRLVVIGGSAGVVEVLSVLLPVLQPPCAYTTVIVVHQGATLPSLLRNVLAPICALPVRDVVDKAPLEAGVVYVAPPDYHVLIERDLTLALSRDAAVHFSRPAIDVTFESAADALGAQVIGVLLTGASEDGARGLAAIAAAGGRVAVQDPASAYAVEMPRAGVAAVAAAVAAAGGAAALVADPARIADWLRTLLPPSEAR